MQNPRFTFCIPNLNKIEYLPACIESVLAQDCEDWCCVFVDGYSTDGSWEYMQQFASDPRFLIRRGIKQGMYADWNECLKHVNTEYFYFLTSDDTCSSQLISKTTSILDQYPSVEACHFKYDLIDTYGNVIQSHSEVLERAFNLYIESSLNAHLRSGICEFFMHYMYGTIYRTITSLVFRTSLLPKMKGFSSLYGSAGDYDWTMRLGLFTDILYIPDGLATWRKYDGQATQNLTASPHKSNVLEIAKANINLFQQLESDYNLKRSFCHKEELLSDFYAEYGRSLREEMLNGRSLDEFLRRAYALFSKCPFYLTKKMINRLSQGKLYQYHLDKKAFALQLISYYGLQWHQSI